MTKCAFDLGEECSALNEKDCVGCNFRKNNKELVEGREKAEAKIRDLETPLRQYLMRKYYGGRRRFNG